MKYAHVIFCLFLVSSEVIGQSVIKEIQKLKRHALLEDQRHNETKTLLIEIKQSIQVLMKENAQTKEEMKEIKNQNSQTKEAIKEMQKQNAHLRHEIDEIKTMRKEVTMIKDVLTTPLPGKTPDKPSESCEWLSKRHFNLPDGGYWLKKNGVVTYRHCAMDKAGIPPVLEYKFSEITLSWWDAEKACNSWGGHLVTIESQQQNDYIHKEVERRYKAGAWIGFSDEKEEGHWEWINPADRSTNYTNWHPRGGGWRGEPNGGRTENCASIAGFTGIGWDWEGYWNDGNCSSHAHFLCTRRKG